MIPKCLNRWETLRAYSLVPDWEGWEWSRWQWSFFKYGLRTTSKFLSRWEILWAFLINKDENDLGDNDHSSIVYLRRAVKAPENEAHSSYIRYFLVWKPASRLAGNSMKVRSYVDPHKYQQPSNSGPWASLILFNSFSVDSCHQRHCRILDMSNLGS